MHRKAGRVVYALADNVYDDTSRSADPARSGVGRPSVGPAESNESESASSTSVQVGRSDDDRERGIIEENVVVREEDR
jgi:hypothetical protein